MFQIQWAWSLVFNFYCFITRDQYYSTGRKVPNPPSNYVVNKVLANNNKKRIEYIFAYASSNFPMREDPIAY
jgi:hypothetical protein